MSFVWRGYVRLLQRHTLPTQMATGGVTASLGDIIYQQAIERRGWENHQLFRTQRLAIYGSCCFAPVANRWHALLAKINVGGKWTTIFARTLTDGLIFAPFATSFFYLCQGTMEGRPFFSDDKGTQGIKERIEERLWGTVQKQWMLFGPTQVINLAYMPVYARPPFMNGIAIGWNVFLAGAQNTGAINPLPASAKTKMSVGSESNAIVAAEVME